MYTDNTFLTSGRYAFVKLCQVPADYLLKIYESNNQQDKELYAYVSTNLERIKAINKVAVSVKEDHLQCKKFTYCSEKDAKDHLHRIEKRVQVYKKPQRAYACDKCGGWHLTAIPFEKWDTNLRPAGVLHRIMHSPSVSTTSDRESNEYEKHDHHSRMPLKGGSEKSGQRNSCKKFSYETDKEAKRQMQNIEKRVPEYKKPVRAYPCQKCGGWHLTSLPIHVRSQGQSAWEFSFKRADVVNQMQWLKSGGHYRLH